ncbi:hypothetical protein C8R43DRAFT_99672 [Mycena crocata]|nr:hypothetical protein C8R43DRAFT_99672 [Mycena crocata]
MTRKKLPEANGFLLSQCDDVARTPPPCFASHGVACTAASRPSTTLHTGVPQAGLYPHKPPEVNSPAPPATSRSRAAATLFLRFRSREFDPNTCTTSACDDSLPRSSLACEFAPRRNNSRPVLPARGVARRDFILRSLALRVPARRAIKSAFADSAFVDLTQAVNQRDQDALDFPSMVPLRVHPPRLVLVLCAISASHAPNRTPENPLVRPSVGRIERAHRTRSATWDGQPAPAAWARVRQDVRVQRVPRLLRTGLLRSRRSRNRESVQRCVPRDACIMADSVGFRRSARGVVVV